MVQTEKVEEYFLIDECLEMFNVAGNWLCLLNEEKGEVRVNEQFMKLFKLDHPVINRDEWVSMFNERGQSVLKNDDAMTSVDIFMTSPEGIRLEGVMKRLSPSRVMVTGHHSLTSQGKGSYQIDSQLGTIPASQSVDHFMTWLSLIDEQLNNQPLSSKSLERFLEAPGGSSVVYNRLKEVVEHIPHGFAVISRDWEILYVNPTLEEILDRSSETLCNRNLWEVFPGEVYQNYYLHYKRAFELNQVVKFQDYIYGTGRVVDVTAYPSNDELTVFVQDITEVNTYIHALQETEERFSLLADNINEAFWVLSSNFQTWEYMSPTFESIFGLSIPVVERDYNTWLDCIHVRDRDRVIRAFRQMGSQKTACEYRFEYEPGVWKWIRTKGYPLEKAEKVMIVGVHEDITDIKEKDELIARSEQFETITRVAAGIAHEIKNPLTSIKGFLQLMMSGESSNGQYGDIVFSELSRIESIVNEFMLLAKPEQEVELEDTNLIDIIHYVLALFRAQCRQGGIKVTTDFDATIPDLPSDPKRLKQIFINVIKNAIEAIDGPGDLTVVGMYKVDMDVVVINISDSGKGIEPEKIKRIGEPFFTTKEKGTGLGMMVTTKFVESLGGTVKYKSEIGDGTTVTITLPVIHSD
ncbi:PAS domain S-box protein [Pontibacillus sp. ALD_SL1]|uniref:ATP-binding protein n=1 Tax=Pontibacillus sp. ALD_SL1 TaxID=2777185 RepID=UPI001A96D0A4|nr:ATP-binding protein [Pontibacillus sp. ALD_SL1]QST00445.1 PAS domain S-box protein [Pontibacillus sp. ALD_SL1]